MLQTAYPNMAVDGLSIGHIVIYMKYMRSWHHFMQTLSALLHVGFCEKIQRWLLLTKVR